MREIYKERYHNYLELHDEASKYEWAARDIFDLTTYDGELDELFVKKIMEVLKVIRDKTNFEYIKDESNYITYIIVCQILERFNWIEWGTSIRGAWFESCHPNAETRPILEEDSVCHYSDGKFQRRVFQEVCFTEDNIKTLIEFMEEDM